MSTGLLERARAGDDQAFADLIEPFRRELQLHCYRILGSTHDAEDALQEALLSAWRGLSGFEGLASLRTWLYRVATNRCLDLLRATRRRLRPEPMAWDVEPPEPTRLGEVLWLEPYPDTLLEGIMDAAPGPEACYESREAISLAFITALQLLPARQRAVLVLRDVLGFRAREVAGMLEVTEESVTSALKRARNSLRGWQAADGAHQAPPPSHSAVEQDVIERFVRAYEAGDVRSIVAMMTDDVRLTMPPTPLEYHGRGPAERFLSIVSMRERRRFKLVPTRANGQPAFGFYVQDRPQEVARAIGLLVVTLSGDRIRCLTNFDTSILPRFGLPRILDET